MVTSYYDEPVVFSDMIIYIYMLTKVVAFFGGWKVDCGAASKCPWWRHVCLLMGALFVGSWLEVQTWSLKETLFGIYCIKILYIYMLQWRIFSANMDLVESDMRALSNFSDFVWFRIFLRGDTLKPHVDLVLANFEPHLNPNRFTLFW